MMERSVISYSEIPMYHELGLGRGVNVTDPQMWRNKSPFQIRNVCSDLTNIIGTEECGIQEKYEKEVSTVATQQLKIRLSLDEPSSRVKIGMDAQNSQSTTSTKKIAGTEVKTRTISFRVDCKDLPVFTSAEDPGDSDYEMAACESDESLETSLYSWLVERIRDRQKKQGHVDHLSKTARDDATRLAKYLHKFRSLSDPKSLKKRTEVAKDCKVFVNDLGITHYVSAIELGALKYSVLAISSHQEKTGAGAQLGAGKMAEGGISGMVGKQWFNKAKEEQTIGKIGKEGTVRRSTEDEAVIRFQIQPIHKLIRLRLIQIALQNAMTEYTKFKADKSGKQISYSVPNSTQAS